MKELKYVKFEPVWFDSLGAKSSCTLIKTPDVRILIDPGIALMQPSFPAPLAKKILWEKRGKKAIIEASEDADIVVISHYHYDHFFPNDLSIYQGKLLFAKNPNEYINDSQRRRAEKFYGKICQEFGKIRLEDILKERKPKKYTDPLEKLPLAARKDFGDYNKRRNEYLAKGRKRFENRVKKWNKNSWIPEFRFKRIEVRWVDGKEFEFDRTKLRFTPPLFHGIEYSRVGWVFSTIIECEGEKIIHSSDLNGVYIEDYRECLIQENPDVLILDGPPTYMIPYTLNLINLKRCIENTCKIISQTKTSLIILDHHLPRDRLYEKRLGKVYAEAQKAGKTVVTAAEYLGKTPKVLERTRLRRETNP